MVEKDTVRRGYDDVADAFADRRSFDAAERTLLEGFLEKLPPSPLLLDAGCGPGTPDLLALVERYPDSPPIGLDISRTQLGLAADAASGATLVQGDFTHVPFEAASVDAVVSLYSLIHVPAAQHQQAIAEFARVLRPGGRLLLSEGTGEWAGRNPDWLDTDAEMAWHIAGADATRRQLEAAGFSIETERTVSDVLVEGESWTFFEAVLPA